MLVIIGGRVGSGKTTVAGMLQEEFEDARVIEADEVGHAVLREDKVKDKLVEVFGEGILVDSEISRAELAKVAFKDKESKLLLNRITHPYITEKLYEYAEDKKRLTIIAAALIRELSLTKIADLLVEVYAPEDAILQRNEGRFPMLEERLQLQERPPEPDVVIDNSGTVEELHRKVGDLAERIRLSLNP